MAKVYLSDVLKAGTGEGSRGGHIVGHTRSGKPIYARSAPNSYTTKLQGRLHPHWTSEDFQDAHIVLNNPASEDHDDSYGVIMERAAEGGVIGHAPNGHPIIANFLPQQYAKENQVFHEAALQLHEAHGKYLSDKMLTTEPNSPEHKEGIRMGRWHNEVRGAFWKELHPVWGPRDPDVGFIRG